MKITTLILGFVILAQSCGEEPVEPESKIGHLTVFLTSPQKVYDSIGDFKWKPFPEEGLVVHLFHEDAECLGFRDARAERIVVDRQRVDPKYSWSSNANGFVNLYNIKAGKYYLFIFSKEWQKYTEKYIEVPEGDTLKLVKHITPDIAYRDTLEPWDYIPEGYLE